MVKRLVELEFCDMVGCDAKSTGSLCVHCEKAKCQFHTWVVHSARSESMTSDGNLALRGGLIQRNLCEGCATTVHQRASVG